MGRRGDLAWAALVVGVVGMMVVPVPTWLLDLLLTANLAGSALVLLLVLRAPDPRRLVSFPTILLLAALLRLALNVSSTRLILLQADAGQVIRAFGQFVVAGNFVVGAVVFLVLTIAQYVVIARGSERVAEVAARFTLDALPGKQLAIDADLRSGAIHPEEARRRRATVERDSQLFGAMDGAMKFVKGDAVATILIVVVNIAGGLAIGIFQRGLAPEEAVSIYSILTIGDGLVAQIPALLTSVAAGLVVTRVTGGDAAPLGADVGAQVLADPGLVGFVAALLAALAIVPGLPAVPLLVLAAAGGVAALGLTRRRRRARAGAREGQSPLVLRLGEGLRAPDVDAIRARVQGELGVALPVIAASRDASLPHGGWTLRIGGAPVSRGVVAADRLLLGDEAESLSRGLAVSLARHAHELLGVQETRALLDELDATHPALVREVVPKLVPLGVVAEVLRRLVAEGVGLRPLHEIVEALGAAAGGDNGRRDASVLAEHVRRALRRRITHHFAPDGDGLDAYLLDPMVEDALRGPSLEPEIADDIRRAVRKQIDARGGDGERPPVIVTSGDLRLHVRRLVEHEMPDIAVVAYQELLPNLTVRPLGRISVATDET
ncbi:MAG: flagellar biosynthesis protein FlhA [Myxococcota bacterium]